MPPTDAVQLINWIPKHSFVEMRGGYESHSTGVGSGDVDTVVEFFDGTTRALISASSTNIYNSTATGAATSLGSGFTNGRWDTAQMSGVMAFVNGADTPQKYDGSTLTTLTITGSGLTPGDLIGVHVHKAKSYFWTGDDQNFWYSATNALGGALVEFPLGDVAKIGGKLLRMESWTVDGGSGPDDYAVFTMSTGEVIVYQGSDPGSALAWNLVGIYSIGIPVDGRAFTRIGGDLAAVVDEDIIFMPSAFSQPSPPATKLSGAIKAAAASLTGNWELFMFSPESLLIINVPVDVSPDSFEQYVLNLKTGAAAKWIDVPARCWTLYNKQAYFGGLDGTVYRYGTAFDDDDSAIDVTSVMAWTELGFSGNKSISALRPWLNVTDAIEVGIESGFDFVEPDVSSPSTAVSGGTPWGSAWGSPWGSVIGSGGMQADWSVAVGRGSMVTVKMRFSRKGDQPKWYKTDALLRAEGNL